MGGVALMIFTGGSDLLLVVAPRDDSFHVFSCIFQPRSEPPSLQFSFNFGTTLDLHFGSFGIILVHFF